MLPADMNRVFKGSYPSILVTCSADGIPNIANLSRVWRLDDGHVAAANQFLNKTSANLNETGLASIHITDPVDLLPWELEARAVRSETDGPLFDQVKRDLQAVSWMAGMSGPVQLRSVIVFEVLAVRKGVPNQPICSQPHPELLGELLTVLGESHGWIRTSYWTVGEQPPALQLAASRGVPGAGRHNAAFEPMRRLAALVVKERDIVRLHDIRSQMRYIHSIRGDSPPLDAILENHAENEAQSGGHYLGIPVIASDKLIGIVSCEGIESEPFDQTADGYLQLLSRSIGQAVASLSPIGEQDRSSLFKQLVERARLEWLKKSEPFHTALSARERQVAIHVAKGLTNAHIAKQLFISTRTVTTHVERIFLKLQIASRAALTRYIVENRLHIDEETGE